MSPLRMAVIGAGDVAERDYLPEWNRVSGRAELAVICGRNPERASRVAREYGAARWCTGYLEALSGGDLDGVVNLTPIDLHYEVTLAALEAGLHVYSEKPLATTSVQARALRDAAAANGVVLVCAPSIELFPQILAVADLVGSGTLGTIRAAHAQAMSGVPPWPGYSSDPSFYFADDAGPLVDMGVYPLHVLTGLLGPVSAVAAMASKTREHFLITEGPFAGKDVPITVGDQWQLLLRFSGCTATLEANFSTAFSAAADCELRGDLGAVCFSLFDVSAPVMVQRRGSADWESLQIDHQRLQGPDHMLGVEHLLDCAEKGTEPVLSAQRAVEVIEIIEAARESARSGRIVAPGPPVEPASGS